MATMQRSDRHRRRRADADGRLPGRFRVAGGERSRRRRDQGRGRARRHQARRRRRRRSSAACCPPDRDRRRRGRRRIKAGLPLATGCTTVNKMCGSAMEATMLAHDALVAKSADVIVAGGMESMSNAPYLMPKARAGYRMGHQTVYDHMFLDGLEDAYDKGRLMGTFAEECATSFAFTREAQDAFATDVAVARARREQGRHVRVGDRAGHRQRQQGRCRRRSRRAAGEGVARQDSHAEAGVQKGWRHRHRGQFELDLGRRGGRGLMRRSTAEAARAEAAGRDRRPCDARAGARAVHDGTRRRDPQAVREDRLDDEATSICSRSTRRSPS